MHQCSAGLLGLQHVDDRRQLLVFDRNSRRDILGLRPGVSHAESNELADLSYLVMHERGLLRSLETWQRRNRPDRPHVG